MAQVQRIEVRTLQTGAAEQQHCQCDAHDGTDLPYGVAKAPAALADLQAQTFPNFASALTERLALEERVRTGPASLNADERQALIRDPFVAPAPKVEKRFASTRIDLRAVLSILAAFVLMIVGSIVVGLIAPEATDVGIAVFIALGVALVIWQTMAGGRR